jgi:hypothetical protein
MKRICCSVVMLCSLYSGRAQQPLTPVIQHSHTFSTELIPHKENSYPGLWMVSRASSGGIQVSPMMSANNYMSPIGFFCRKEIQFQELTHVPFKFRLGSVEYTDYLEGKNNSGFLNSH